LCFLRVLAFRAKLLAVFSIKARVCDAATGVRKHASRAARDIIQFR
jgi:hypothetical protein